MNGFSRILTIILVAFGVNAHTRAACAGDFIVSDGRADQEISENSRLYVDGKLVATFALGPEKTEQRQLVRIPDGRIRHDYALCGEITVQEPDGRHVTHEVSSEGYLNSPEGHTLLAVGTDGFTEFFLADPGDPSVSEHHPGRSEICSPPSS